MLAQKVPFNPTNQSLIENPFPTYAALRETSPVFFCEHTNSWMLMRHSDCVEALKGDSFSADRMRQHVSNRFPEAVLDGLDFFLDFIDGAMMFVDSPLHNDVRSLASKGYRTEAVRGYKSMIERLAKDLVRKLPYGEFDAQKDVAEVLPLRVVVEVFGIPEEHRMDFRAWTHDIVLFFKGVVPEQEIGAIAGSLKNLLNLLQGLIDQRRVNPGDDLVSNSIGDPKDDKQVCHQLVLQIVAGHAPTTPTLIGNGIHQLLMHPDQLALLRNEEATWSQAVEEVARVGTSLQYSHRVAACDLTLHGQQIRKGELVSPVLGSANRDERVFEEPEAFLIQRDDIRNHLGFGVGKHRCLGAVLPRTEAAAVWEAVFSRFPNLTLAGRPVWDSSLNFRKLTSLPVRPE